MIDQSVVLVTARGWQVNQVLVSANSTPAKEIFNWQPAVILQQI